MRRESIRSWHTVISHRFPDGMEKSIAYASRSLSPAEKNYSQIERERLAIVFSVTKFYMYLYGRKLILHTDHKPLLKIFSPNSATPVLAASRLLRWVLLLSSYRCDIEYKPSRDIANADALSRMQVLKTQFSIWPPSKSVDTLLRLSRLHEKQQVTRLSLSL